VARLWVIDGYYEYSSGSVFNSNSVTQICRLSETTSLDSVELRLHGPFAVFHHLRNDFCFGQAPSPSVLYRNGIVS